MEMYSRFHHFSGLTHAVGAVTMESHGKLRLRRLINRVADLCEESVARMQILVLETQWEGHGGRSWAAIDAGQP